MHLKLKAAVVFLFFSLILFGFSYEPGLPVNNLTTTPESVQNQAVKIGSLPDEVKESSGIEEGSKPGTFLTHNDAGNAPELFRIDATGKLLGTLLVAGADNIDWEDLTRDDQGNIYIGDIGNNSNKRTKFKIYKLKQGNPTQVTTIDFEYADRKAGTTDKNNFEFDSEALFWYRSKLYLVTKDRDAGINARIYALSDQPGEQEARMLTSYNVNAPVTSADISPDGKTLLLLSEGQLHLFKTNGSTDFFKSKMETRSLGKVGQTEAAVFIDNNTIIITSEKGNIYQYKL